MDKATLELLNRKLKHASFESQTLAREYHDNFYWHSRINIFNLLEVGRYNSARQFYDFYYIYTERFFTRDDILLCTYQANRIASFLCLLREPERELIILFNEMFDKIINDFTPYVKDEMNDYLTGSLYNEHVNTVGKDYTPKPTAKLLDGIFSMAYYMLKVQPVKSTKIELVLKMIERHLYPFINTLTDEHRFLREGYGVLYANQTLGEDTLLDAIIGYIKDKGEYCNVPDLTNVSAFIADYTADITYSYHLEDVRILTSLCPTEEEQGWALSQFVHGIRKTFIECMGVGKETDEQMRTELEIIRSYGNKKFYQLLPINADNYAEDIKRLAEFLEPPREWGYRDDIVVEEYDDEGNVIYTDDDYIMEQKLEPIFYGLTDNTKVDEDKEMKEQMRREEILDKARPFKITVGENSNERVSDDIIIKVHDFIEREYMNEEREAGVSVALFLLLIEKDIIISQTDFPRLMKAWFAEFKGSQSSISNFASLQFLDREEWKSESGKEKMFEKICTMYDKLINEWSD